MKALRTIHTIKGNARNLGFTYIAEEAHRVEDELLKPGAKASAMHLKQGLERIKLVMDEHQSIIAEKLSSSEDNIEHAVIFKKVEECLQETVMLRNPAWFLEAIRTEHARIQHVSLREAVAVPLSTVAAVALSLGKAAPQILIDDGSILFSEDSCRDTQ